MKKIPEAAFREAIANALIHRVWDVESHIRVLMFDDSGKSKITQLLKDMGQKVIVKVEGKGRGTKYMIK